jgi:acetylornithine/N-succinyldiaminopimelate aminotransferase
MSSVLPVYRRSNIVIARGEGVYLFSPEGERYLDFASGIAVNALGHCHPHVVSALKTQADMLWHCSNMYRTQGLERFADRLIEGRFADKIFFCNSGSEAVECGLKMIRKYHDTTGHPNRYRIITMTGGFHGRTLACISAGGNDIARKGYAPLLDGFDRVAFNDLSAVEAAIGPDTAGILIEPVQGEGGVHVASAAFLKGVRALADKHGLLLFFDEVQCGLGRTGHWFAHERAGVSPDIMSVAKGIGNGFPLGACLATARAAQGMVPGSHGSTYGSNPLAMAVGNAVLDVMQKPGFLEHVQKVSASLKEGLQNLANGYPALFSEVRGTGLLLGVQVQPSVGVMEMVERLRARRLLMTAAEGNVLRIVPPLVIEEQHVQDALVIMQGVCKEWA